MQQSARDSDLQVTSPMHKGKVGIDKKVYQTIECIESLQSGRVTDGMSI
jgi:hypothetical protein